METAKGVTAQPETIPAGALRPAMATATRSAASEQSLFNRLATIRLPLIVMVVCYHNEAGGGFVAQLDAAPALRLVVDFLANGLGGVRVPVFFLIAGYVFFRNFEARAQWFLRKIAARARSVLLPLVLWSMLWLLVIGAAQSTPGLQAFFAGKSIWSAPLGDYTAWQWVTAIVGQPDQLFLYHLWFLRDLFILVLLSPLIYGVHRATRGWATVVFLAAWLLGGSGAVSRDALFFFALGCHLSMANRSIFLADRLGMAALAGWLLLRGFDATHVPLAYRAWILFGVVATLYLSRHLDRLPRVSDVLRASSRYSFFVFVAHEPLLTVVRRLYLKALPTDTPLALFAAYFAIVTVTVGLLILTHRLAERLFPRALDLLSGGRG